MREGGGCLVWNHLTAPPPPPPPPTDGQKKKKGGGDPASSGKTAGSAAEAIEGRVEEKEHASAAGGAQLGVASSAIEQIW